MHICTGPVSPCFHQALWYQWCWRHGLHFQSNFQIRFPFIAVRHLKLISSPRAIVQLWKTRFSSVPLGAAGAFVHFGSGKGSAAPAWLGKERAGVPQLRPGRLSRCLVAHVRQGTVTSQESGMPDNTRLVSAGSLSVCFHVIRVWPHSSWSRPCQIRAVSVVSLSVQLWLLLFQRECREGGLGGLVSAGELLHLALLPLQDPPKLQALQEGRLGWKGSLNFGIGFPCNSSILPYYSDSSFICN